jgi:hypothetical protein
MRTHGQITYDNQMAKGLLQFLIQNKMQLLNHTNRHELVACVLLEENNVPAEIPNSILPVIFPHLQF